MCLSLLYITRHLFVHGCVGERLGIRKARQGREGHG
jgi:hypothetical protein